MRLERLVARGFRNLADTELAIPEAGVILLGDNGQGKTNLLEAVYYPVLFRSFHGAADRELVRFGGPGLRIDADWCNGARRGTIGAGYDARQARKRVEVDGVPAERLADAVGQWLAVAFLPEDLRLASGAAAERRRYLDRMLALADREYFQALTRYRAALAQRNAALRQDRADLARAFDGVLAEAGSIVVRGRLAWIADAAVGLGEQMASLGEPGTVTMAYGGNADLAGVDAWPGALEAVWARDRQRRASTIGPHRDDLRLGVGGHGLRAYGSTGQQRTAAIALKLLELATLERARGVAPALLLDDVFAELDRDRQRRLADRLIQASDRQVFLSSPRSDELPENLALPIWRIEAGRVIPAG